MKDKYSNEIQYLMQGRYTKQGRYFYHLVCENLVDAEMIEMLPYEASKFCVDNNLERVSSGSMAIMRTECWSSNPRCWPEKS